MHAYREMNKQIQNHTLKQAYRHILLNTGYTIIIQDTPTHTHMYTYIQYLWTKIHIHTQHKYKPQLTLSEHFIRYLLDLFFLTYWPSAAVACPLRGLTHCVFRDALLHTTVVMCGYLRYCHLPLSWYQSGPSPLTFLINEAC